MSTEVVQGRPRAESLVQQARQLQYSFANKSRASSEPGFAIQEKNSTGCVDSGGLSPGAMKWASVLLGLRNESAMEMEVKIGHRFP